MECRQFWQRCLPQEHLRAVPWLLALCGAAAASQCTFGMAQLQAPSCELLNPVLAGNLVIPAAIPLPPVVPKQAVPPKRIAAGLGQSGNEHRLIGSVNLQDGFEGSFNFAHPGYLWIYELQQFSSASDEPLNHVPEVWWQSDYGLQQSNVPMGKWTSSREILQHKSDHGQRSD